MNKKDTSILSSIVIVLPCISEIFIFQCFRFADWRLELSSELQFRVLWGTIAITLFFIVYYIFTLIWVIRFYTYEDRTNKILKISLFAILGFMSSVVGYFL
jgi:hypothetical protein